TRSSLRSRAITAPSALLRTTPPLCPASVLSRSWGLPTCGSPFTSERQVPTFRTRAQSTVTPPPCRTPCGQYTGSPHTAPGLTKLPPVLTSPRSLRHVLSGSLTLVSALFT